MAGGISSLPDPQDTGKISTAGRPIWRAHDGEEYSEKTVTLQTPQGWVVVPSVFEHGRVVEDQGILEDFYGQNGYVDPITMEKLKFFKTLEEADRYAIERSGSLMPKGE